MPDRGARRGPDRGFILIRLPIQQTESNTDLKRSFKKFDLL